MGVRIPDSVEKICKQLGAVASRDFTAFGSIYNAPDEVILSQSFYRKFNCYSHCGGCCLNFTLDWLPDEKPLLLNLYPNLEDLLLMRSIEVDGKISYIYTIDQGKGLEFYGKNWCKFLNPLDQSCDIHKLNPASCQIELIKFRSMRTSTSLRGYVLKGPFGRGWEMTKASDGKWGVPCDFEPFDMGQFIQNDLIALRRMARWADHLGVHTYLPEIIRHAQEQVSNQTFRSLRIEKRLSW